MRKPSGLLIGAVMSLMAAGSFVGAVAADKKAKKTNEKAKTDKVIAKVGSEEITFSQLERAFKKNMSRKNVGLADISKDSISDFVKLYVNYRLKVNDALNRGFDKDSAVKLEIEQNRKILAESFYYDKKITEPQVEKWLKLRDKEYKVAVIIAAFPMPGDTASSFAKINKALEELKSGTSFEEAAAKYSDDPGTKSKGGVVGRYLMSAMVHRDLENGFINLKPGEYTPTPVRTKSGYFIIKMLDVQPRLLTKSSQILIDASKDSVEAKNKADEIYAKLKSGANFEELAKQYSNEEATAKNGGRMEGWYSRSGGGDGFVAEYEQTLYSLKDGEISKPVKSMYGWHIIRKDSTKAPDLSLEKEDLKLGYKRLYFNDDKRAILDKLADEYGFKINDASMKHLLNAVDTTKTNLDSNWATNVPPFMRDEVLFKFMNNEKTTGEFVTTMSKAPDLRGTATNEEGFKKVIRKMIDPQVFAEASKNLENDYPEFKTLVNEFRDGILLFKVEEQEVWSKLKFDSILAKQYYDTTTMNLTREPMYDVDEIFCFTDSSAKFVYNSIKKGEITFEAAAEKYTQRPGFRAKKGHWGPINVKKNALAKFVEDRKPQPGVIMDPFEFERGWAIVRMNKFEDTRKKTFEEAIPDIAPKIQDVVQKNLTEKWLNKVKETCPVTINENAINEIKK